MKQILSVILSVLLLAAPVMAATELGVDAGTLPNQWTYSFKKIGESVGLAFAFGADKKAELKYEYALKRLAEAEAMAEKNEYGYTERLMNQYQENLQAAEQYAKEAEQLGKNITQLAQHVQTMTQKQQQVLQMVRESAPESALQGIDVAIQVTLQSRDRIREHWEAQEQEMNQGEAQNQEQNQQTEQNNCGNSICDAEETAESCPSDCQCIIEGNASCPSGCAQCTYKQYQQGPQ